MKKALLNLWKFLDGKKTTIFAVSYWLLHKVHKGVKSLNKGAKSLNIV